jgi:ubiquinone/menaquinone biosynthesis C-methylase UbiE
MTLSFARLSPDVYEQALVGPVFRPFAEHVIVELDVAAGDRVLDIACGTGIVARLARQRVGETGKVVGVDLSPAMLTVAREVAEDIEWREGDARALPVDESEQFEVVICQQGLQFVSDRAAAAREMRRALVAGGRLAVSTWRPDEELPFPRELRAVAERQVGPIVDRRHSFGESGPLEALLEAAGFRGVRSKTVTRTVRFEDGSVFVRLNAMALVGMSASSSDLSDEERARAVETIVRDSADVVAPYTTDDGLAYEISTNVATATG